MSESSKYADGFLAGERAQRERNANYIRDQARRAPPLVGRSLLYELANAIEDDVVAFSVARAALKGMLDAMPANSPTPPPGVLAEIIRDQLLDVARTRETLPAAPPDTQDDLTTLEEEKDE